MRAISAIFMAILTCIMVVSCTRGAKEYTYGKDIFTDPAHVEGDRYVDSSGKPLNGKAVVHSPDGVMKIYGTFKNGLMDGKMVTETQDIKQEYVVKDGRLDGIAKFYYEGTLRDEIPFQDNIVTGMAKTYYPDGTLRSESPYVHGTFTPEGIEGTLHGVEKFYTETGAIIYESSYDNGLRNGPTRLYNEEGDAVIDVVFRNGQPYSGIVARQGETVEITPYNANFLDAEIDTMFHLIQSISLY